MEQRECSKAIEKLSLSENSGTNYVDYLTYHSSIKNQFMFDCIDFDYRPELLPYVVPSLGFINENLILCNSNEVGDKIDEFQRIVLLVNGWILNGDTDLIINQFYLPKHCFNFKRFTMLWVNLTTTMQVKLDYNYGWRTDLRRKKTTCASHCKVEDGFEKAVKADEFKRPIQVSYYDQEVEDEPYLDRNSIFF